MDGKIKHFKSELTVANGKVVYSAGQDRLAVSQSRRPSVAHSERSIHG
jgi:hypothetical protein